MSDGAIRAGWSGARPRVSVLILTLNEEVNIRACIESCAWCDDVHVLDSGSEDRTVALAEELGATVSCNPFESFGKQRNWAIDHIEMKHDWVFHLDADERMTPELVNELQEVLDEGPTEAGFHVPNKLMFMGRWLRRAGSYPTYQMRFFHKGRMRFIDYGHGQREQPGTTIGTLREPYLHYAFSKGIYDWLDKHNRYSSLEAIQIVEAREGLRLTQLFASDPVRRRRAWKELAYHLPFRSFLRWFMIMFVLGGVVEGRAGWTYAQLMATYERMTTLKTRLLKRAAARGLAPGFEVDTTPKASTKVVRPVKDVVDVSGRGAEETSELVTESDRGRSGSLEVAHEEASNTSGTKERVDEEGQLLPESSPWTLKAKIGRALWMLVGQPIFRLSFHNWYGFRRGLLRLFGAKVGRDVRVRPTVKVEVPWNIDLRDGATVGDFAILYSLGQITIGERAIVSQYSHLCAGTHDFTDRRFPLIRDPISIGPDAWIGADAYIGPKVHIGRLSVLGARSSAYKDLEAGWVYAGNPAKKLKERELA